jgi:hypothetical protein
LPRRDDQLAAEPIGDRILIAVLDQLGGSGDAKPCLERIGLVVDACVDDSTVVSRLMPGDPRLFLENDESRPRSPSQELARRGKPDDACADDDHVSCPVDVVNPAASHQTLS